MTVTENTGPTNEAHEHQPTCKAGRIVAIAGPVVDVEFPVGALPDINTALEMTITVERRGHHRRGRDRPAARLRAACGPSA